MLINSTILILSLLQVHSQPSWQAQAVSDYLALVAGTNKQPSTSNKIIRGTNIGTFNKKG